MTDRETGKNGDVQRWRETFRELQGPGSAGCPDEEQLAALAVGELDEDDAAGIADHATSCRRCSALLKDLLELDAVAGDRPASVRSRRWVPLVAAAAVVVAAVLLVPHILQEEAPPVPTVVRGEQQDVRAVEPADRAMLAEFPDRFQWAGAEVNALSRVVLLDHESTPIWQSEWLPASGVDVPEELRSRLQPGRVYFWRVETRSGVERRQTPSYRFEVGR